MAGGDEEDDEAVSPPPILNQSSPDYRLSSQSDKKDIEFFISSDARLVPCSITFLFLAGGGEAQQDGNVLRRVGSDKLGFRLERW